MGLGTGWYDQWQDLEAAYAREHERLTKIERWLRPYTTGDLMGMLLHVNLLDKVASEYAEGMSYLAAGKGIDTTQQEAMYDIYSLTLGLVEQEHDILEAAWLSGFVTLLVKFPVALIRLKAKRLKEALEELEQLLKDAERNVKEAWAQMAINGAIVGLHILFPHISCSSERSWWTRRWDPAPRGPAGRWSRASRSTRTTWSTRWRRRTPSASPRARAKSPP